MAVVVPLRMPKLSRLEAEQRNAIAAWRSPLRIPNYEGLTLERVRPADVQNVNAPEADSFVAEVAYGNDTLRMTLSRALASNLLAALEAGVMLDPFPPSDLAALLLEIVVLPFLEKLERNTGRSLRLTALGPAQAQNAGATTAASRSRDGAPVAIAGSPPTATVHLLLRGPGMAETMKLQGPEGAVALLLRLWPIGARPLEQIRVPASFQIGATRLPHRLVTSLRIGDAVLLQELFMPAPGDEPFPHVLQMVLASRLIMRTCRVDRGWQVEGGQRVEQEEGNTVDQQDSPSEAPVRDFDDLPIRLVFEVARMTIPLGELRQLDTGSLLEVDVKPGTVRILASGQPIGTGELILIDGRTGVRITEFFASVDVMTRRSIAG
jgi:type III secretion protein Q